MEKLNETQKRKTKRDKKEFGRSTSWDLSLLCGPWARREMNGCDTPESP
jgi:hypothetical protein